MYTLAQTRLLIQVQAVGMEEKIRPDRAFGRPPSRSFMRTADVCLIINVFGVDVTYGIDEQG